MDILIEVMQQTADMVLRINPIHHVAMLGRHAIYVCRGVPSGVCYTAHVCNSIRKSRPTGTYISSQLYNAHMHTLDKHNHCMTALI